MNEQLLEVLIFALGVGLSAFFSGSEAALISIPSKRVKQILRKKHKSKDDLDDLKNIIHETGGFHYAISKIDEFSSNALNSIKIYPDSVYKESLTDLVAFNAQRAY